MKYQLTDGSKFGYAGGVQVVGEDGRVIVDVAHSDGDDGTVGEDAVARLYGERDEVAAKVGVNDADIA